MSNVGKHDFRKQNGCQSAILDLNPNMTEQNENRNKTEQLWFCK
jgi:hypothetical protein